MHRAPFSRLALVGSREALSGLVKSLCGPAVP